MYNAYFENVTMCSKNAENMYFFKWHNIFEKCPKCTKNMVFSEKKEVF